MTSFHSADGIELKMFELKLGEEMLQHKHDHDHLTMLAVGKVNFYVEGVLIREVTAPDGIEVMAGAFHQFQALEDSLLFCIHNVSRTGEIEIAEEHPR